MPENSRLPGSDIDRLALGRVLRHRFGKSLDSVELQNALDEGVDKTIQALTIHTIEDPSAYANMACNSVAIKMIKRKTRECSMTKLVIERDSEDGAAGSREAEDMVRQIFKRMIPTWQEVLKLGSEGFSVGEIAEKIGKTKKAIYHLKERAEKKFYELGIKLGMSPPRNNRARPG